MTHRCPCLCDNEWILGQVSCGCSSFLSASLINPLSDPLVPLGINSLVNTKKEDRKIRKYYASIAGSRHPMTYEYDSLPLVISHSEIVRWKDA